LPFITVKGQLIGYTIIYPNTFPPNTILSISTPKEIPSIKSNTDSHSKDGCNGGDSTKEPVDRVSPLVDIKADNAPNSNFDPPVKLQLGVAYNSSNSNIDSSSSVCLGYSRDQEPLHCNPNSGSQVTDVSTSSRRGVNSTVVQGETTHFTTFAVLLVGAAGVFPSSNHCDIRWLWPVSFALFGAFLLAIPIVVTIINNTRLKRWFYGYHARSMNQVESLLKKKQKGRSSRTAQKTDLIAI